MPGGGYDPVVMGKGQSLKGHMAQVVRDYELRQLRNNYLRVA